MVKHRTSKSKSKSLLKFLTSRLFVFSFLILIQAAIFVIMLLILDKYLFYFDVFCTLLSLVICFYIVIKEDNPIYKMAWIIPVLTLPILGGFFYLLFGNRNVSPKISREITKSIEDSKSLLPDNSDVAEQIRKSSPNIAKQSEYIEKNAIFPAYKNTQATYLSPGEEKFAALVSELKKAEKFILLEYFIIEEGVMWNTVLDILKQKVKQGVEVKVMYDDLGTIRLLPSKYYKQLQSCGIECAVFNPFHPSLDTFMNYRDHRKIAVIDGNVGFTGGINLADEYINAYEKHGHWKDASVMIKGEAVWNLTVLFFQLWQCAAQSKEPIDFERYKPTVKLPGDGYVQPFGDSPIDRDLVGEMVYMNMINNAEKYIYICTPYLILDNEMITALKLAAQSGIDVKIITPHCPDKVYVHAVTRSNYAPLLDAGVKIYEYTPGFIHSKSVVCDDELAVIGTTNFDFRSFYLHFECGIFFYKNKVVNEAYDDFINTLKVSEEITQDCSKKINIITKLFRALLRLFAPLM